MSKRNLYLIIGLVVLILAFVLVRKVLSVLFWIIAVVVIVFIAKMVFSRDK